MQTHSKKAYLRYKSTMMMTKTKFSLILLLTLVGVTGVFAQNTGDTTLVQSLIYSAKTRDTVVQFPAAGKDYQKVYMQYSMRCKNAQVSTGSDRNKGCGEWDYSCNTYLHDSTHVDSITATHPNYIISGLSGNIFDYSINPTYNYYQTEQNKVVLNSTISDTASTVGAGSLAVNQVLHTDTLSGKAQYLFTAAELISAGMHAGNIDAITLNVTSNPEKAKMFKVKMKSVTAATINASSPELTGMTEVFYYQYNFVSGSNRIQFSTPFAWDGTSNVVIETSFTNKTAGAGITFSGNNTAGGITSYGDNLLDFNISNYIEVPGYKGILGSGNRTCEAWIKTNNAGSEIMAWGNNATSEKWLLRIDGTGNPRVEVNGGNAIGSTIVNDGEWHHIAAVIDGNNTSDVTFYVDGVLSPNSVVAAKAINTSSNIDFRISRGHHNNYLVGNIADVRVWDKALTQSEVQNWMNKKLDATHPSYANLQVYFPLNDKNGTTVTDLGPNGYVGNVIGGAGYSSLNGESHFKGFEAVAERPNLEFHQGQYNLTISTDTITDTVEQTPYLVREYNVFSKAGTVRSDSLGVVSSNNYYLPKELVYNQNGTIINVINLTPDGTINISDLPYFQRSPSKFELVSFVTPYGINLDLGPDGKSWWYDITDFYPILNGKKRLTMEWGGQNQEEIDIKFLFIEGTPARNVLDIQQIWKVEKKSNSSIRSDASFEPRMVPLMANASAFKVRSAITGHGQDGEFIPRSHMFNVAGGSPEFTWTVWKECAYNPVYPQGGTWIYDRAGWCPGMATDVYEHDITSFVTPGQTAELDYNMASATGTSDYIVSHQLVTYGAANFTNDASMVKVISPSNNIEFARAASICDGPKVVIQNTGSATLTSLTIEYWINGASTPQTYNWTGSLAFLETQEVSLPATGALWDGISGSLNKFYAEVKSPNGTADEYSYNNLSTSQFELPEVLPNNFYISLRTNSKGNESSYEVLDQWGGVVVSRSGMSNNSYYYDTLNLADGCYTFKLYDAGHNGISFWANNDGSGSLIFRNALNNLPVKSFNGDFGAELALPFTVNSPLSYEELNPITKIEVYPNPAQDQFTVALPDAENSTVTVYNSAGQAMNLSYTVQGNNMVFNTNNISEGVYYIHVKTTSSLEVKKIVVM